jgi:hypothetical protein
MTRTTFTADVTDAQAQILRRVVALMEDLDHVADTAAAGTVLDACEAAVLTGGRDLQRALLERAVQRRIDAAEKKGRRCAPAAAAGRRRTAARPPGRC